MKVRNYFVGAFLAFSSVSFATSPVLSEVAQSLKKIKVAEVAKFGKVLKENHHHPYTDILVAIPAKVAEESACTHFVGQQTSKNVNGMVSLSVLGSFDPTVDACIEIYPEPVDTQLTVQMNVVTGGFVPAERIQKQMVQIEGAGLFLIELDMDNQTVAVKPIKIR